MNDDAHPLMVWARNRRLRMKASDIEFIVTHCSATKKRQYVDAEIIDMWHKARFWTDSNGNKHHWSGIGYHFVILQT